MSRWLYCLSGVIAGLALSGWLVASGRLERVFASEIPAESRTAAPVTDGSILPFPPTPSGSTAGLTMQDSVYKKRVEPKRLAEGVPNILVILMDDVGPGTLAPWEALVVDAVGNVIDFWKFKRNQGRVWALY